MSIAMQDLDQLDFSDVADITQRIAHPHVGQYLRDEFLTPLGLSKYRLAKETGLAASRIGEIVAGRRAVTADTALRLGRYLGTSAQFWLNLQMAYDLECTAQIKINFNKINPLKICIAT